MTQSNPVGAPHSRRAAARGAPTTIAGYALAVAKALEARGIDGAPILASVGIGPDISNDPLNRVPVTTMTRLFRACVDVTHDPYFGLAVAKYVQLSNLHALGHALAASATLLEFCNRLARYFRLASQSSELRVVEGDQEIAVEATALVEVCGETEDAFVGFVVHAMRRLHKLDFNPLRVEFIHAMPRGGDAPYREFFRAPVLFNRPGPMLVMSRAELEQPLIGASIELAQLHDNLATSYIARIDKDDVVSAVRHKIIEFLPNGSCTRVKVAKAIGLSPSTLQLKLAQRGTTFHDLLEETRKELAESYLAQASMSVTEITFLLGFSDTSNFTRAFKRWEGVSPTHFREGSNAA